MLETHDFNRLPSPPVSVETTRSLLAIGTRGCRLSRWSAILRAAERAFTVSRRAKGELCLRSRELAVWHYPAGAAAPVRVPRTRLLDMTALPLGTASPAPHLPFVSVSYPPPLHAQPDFGDNTSQWANDGECDDPRFEGEGAAETLLDAIAAMTQPIAASCSMPAASRCAARRPRRRHRLRRRRAANGRATASVTIRASKAKAWRRRCSRPTLITTRPIAARWLDARPHRAARAAPRTRACSAAGSRKATTR